MDLPYNWDFIQNNIPSEKLAELRRIFMEVWHFGRYTKKEMMERYRMSERTFRNTIKKYAVYIPIRHLRYALMVGKNSTTSE